MSKSTDATPSRSGVFGDGPDTRVEAFCESHTFDRRLYQHDIAGSIAHAQMLEEVGVLSADENRQIAKTLREIEQQIDRGEMTFSNTLEDIHMHIEKALIDRLGDTGPKTPYRTKSK